MTLENIINQHGVERIPSQIEYILAISLEYKEYTTELFFENKNLSIKLHGDDYSETRFISEQLDFIKSKRELVGKIDTYLEDNKVLIKPDAKKTIEKLLISYEKTILKVEDFLNNKLIGLFNLHKSITNKYGHSAKQSVSLLYLFGFFNNTELRGLTINQRDELLSVITGHNPKTLTNYIKAFMNEGSNSYDSYIDVEKEVKNAKKIYKELILR